MNIFYPKSVISRRADLLMRKKAEKNPAHSDMPIRLHTHTSVHIDPAHHQDHQHQSQSAMREAEQSLSPLERRYITTYRLECDSQMSCEKVMQITGPRFAGSTKPCCFCHVWAILFTSGSF